MKNSPHASTEWNFKWIMRDMRVDAEKQTREVKKKSRPFPTKKKNIDKKYQSRRKKRLQAEKSNIQSGAAE